ncbi:SRPBCC family protein [Nocardioides bruguierae]|uniref:SRPBCC family protein n=1 Tax=Nocardioides bruguierae TaxID=2945102 RepID=A0A9X2DA13_9ACTN|nr:SRPBCC family protein [Nocardioides bruguierae]MCL8025767.1 SRPBCC family protein [Nocardioides bruguierae]MCM0622062.1 SRPBCC family protein [Nocardioides bruguierae]
MTDLAAEPRACFDLSLSVDLHTASMAASEERAVAGVTSGVMGPGETVTWRARHFGWTFTMTSEISEHDPPHRFVDRQVRGPFGRWWHEHAFEAVPGGTRMTDRVDYAAPLGPLGRAVDALVLARYLIRLLEERNAHLVRELGPLHR